MSVSTDIISFFMRQIPGTKCSAGEVQGRGGFTSSQNVYAQLAIMAQPGGPLMRERESRIYFYRIRPGADLSPYRETRAKGISKTAAAQAPCYSEVKPEATEAGRASSGRSTSVPPTPDATKSTGEDVRQDDHRVPAQPAPAAAPQNPVTPAMVPVLEIPRFHPVDPPKPAKAEAARFIEDLRIRRDTLDEVIRLLETTFGAKS